MDLPVQGAYAKNVTYLVFWRWRPWFGTDRPVYVHETNVMATGPQPTTRLPRDRFFIRRIFYLSPVQVTSILCTDAYQEAATDFHLHSCLICYNITKKHVEIRWLIISSRLSSLALLYSFSYRFRNYFNLAFILPHSFHLFLHSLISLVPSASPPKHSTAEQQRHFILTFSTRSVPISIEHKQAWEYETVFCV